MKEKGEVNFFETFTFKDIPFQPYPVYSVSEKGRVYNLKSVLYPNPSSIKKFTRNKQLKNRSIQARMFDMLINIGYWEPLICIREFPIIIQNHLRLKNLDGGYFLLDYYFPNLCLAVELDSKLHNPEKDKLRDEYMERIGIKTWRILNLDKSETQKKSFRELTKYMRSLTPISNPPIFSFMDNIKLYNPYK